MNSPKFPPITKYLLLALFILFEINSFGQSNKFITEFPINEQNKSDSLIKYEQNIKRHGIIKSLNYVKIGLLSKAQKDGYLELYIPGRVTSIAAKAKNVKYISDQDYEWVGKSDEDRGTIILICNNGVFQAHISTPDGVYEILPAPGGLHSLHEMDSFQASDVGCSVISSRSGLREAIGTRNLAEQKRGHNAQRMDPCSPQTNPRVLVLYTPNALAAANGDVSLVQSIASMSITQFNTCTYNSDIQSGAVLWLAGVAPLNLIETASIKKDLSNLINSSTVSTLRNNYVADLVILLTDGYYSGGATRGASDTSGMANKASFAVVEIWAATACKTFPHEVGHLFDCRHDGAAGVPNYAQAHNISNGLWIVDRTMMSTHTADGSNRLLNFSNPNKSVGGKVTGTFDHNNAKRISETHSLVSDFKPNLPGTFNVYLEGPTYVTSEGARQFEMVYKCGSGPYSFSWAYSSDGVNYFPTGSNSDILNWYFYQSQTLFLKGTVTNNGQSYTSFTTVDVQIPNNNRQGFDNPNTVENQNFEIFPNPVRNAVKINYNVSKPAIVRLEILDHSGQLIKSIKNDSEIVDAGTYSSEWDTKDISAGIYLCRLQIGESKLTSRIIVLK